MGILHVVAFALGYVVCKVIGFDEKTARTVSIETGMQSAALGFLLAQVRRSLTSSRAAASCCRLVPTPGGRQVTLPPHPRMVSCPSQKHFTDPLVAVPSAVSVVFMALGGSALAVYWRGQPIQE